MRLLLKEDVGKLGRRGDMVDVKAGYARNYLLPQGMGIAVTQRNLTQIERAKAVQDIEDLLSVPGVGGAIIGPNDLALSMGVRSDDMLGALEDPIQRVLDAALRARIPCGIHIANLDWLAEWQRRGMQLICYSKAASFLRNGAASGISKLRESAKPGV